MKRFLLSASLLALFSGANAQWIGQITQSVSGRGIRQIDAVDAQTVWGVLYDGSGSNANIQELITTTDGGNNWNSITVTAASGAYGIANISAVDANVAYISVYPAGSATAKQGIYRTTNAGATWTKVTSGSVFGSSSFIDGVHFWDAANGFAFGDPVAGEYEMYTTNDSGNTWTPVPADSIPAPSSGTEYGYVGVLDVVGDNIMFGSNTGHIYISHNRGASWTVASPGATDINEVKWISATEGYARQIDNTNSVNDLYMTMDGGTTWNLIQYTGNLFTAGFDFVPNSNPTILVSTGAAQNATGTSYSLDMGLTWNDLETGTQRLDLNFVTDSVAWCGGFSSGAGSEGIYIWDPSFNGTINAVKQNLNTGTLVSVSPNPNNGNFMLEFRGVNGNQVSVKVMDITGKVVATKNIQAGYWIKENISLNNANAGIYFVEVSDATQKYITRVVVK